MGSSESSRHTLATIPVDWSKFPVSNTDLLCARIGARTQTNSNAATLKAARSMRPRDPSNQSPLPSSLFCFKVPA